MNELRENVFNIKANPRHCYLEFAIRREEDAYENSRSDLFKRMIDKAEHVENWLIPQQLLGRIEEEDKAAPIFTSWQARYDDETKSKLTAVVAKMQQDLIAGGAISKYLRSEYVLRLLMVNYLARLKEEKTALTANYIAIEKEKIGLPEISALLTELILTDRENDALAQIQNILIKWRKEKNDNGK